MHLAHCMVQSSLLAPRMQSSSQLTQFPKHSAQPQHGNALHAHQDREEHSPLVITGHFRTVELSLQFAVRIACNTATTARYNTNNSTKCIHTGHLAEDAAHRLCSPAQVSVTSHNHHSETFLS